MDERSEQFWHDGQVLFVFAKVFIIAKLIEFGAD
jgi:hypothetical protein